MSTILVSKEATAGGTVADNAAFTSNTLKLAGKDVWLQCVLAAAMTGVYTFWGSIDGTTFTQLSLATTTPVHSTPTAGTAVLTGNTIVQVRGTRSAGGGATNLVISACATSNGSYF